MAEIWNYSKFKLTDAMRIRGVKDLEGDNLERMLDLIDQSHDIDNIDDISKKFLGMMQELGHDHVVLGRPVHLLPYLIPLLQRNGIEIYVPYNQVTSEQFMHPDEDVTAVQSMVFRNHLVHVKHYPQIMPAEVKRIWSDELMISVEAVPDMSEFKANPLLEISTLSSRVSTWNFDSREQMIDWLSEVKSGVGLERIFCYEISNRDEWWEMFDTFLSQMEIDELDTSVEDLSGEPIWNYSLMPPSNALEDQKVKEIDTDTLEFLESNLKFFDAHDIEGEKRLEEIHIDDDIETIALSIARRIKENGHKKVMLSRPEHIVPYLIPILQSEGIVIFTPIESVSYEHYADWMVTRSLMENVYFTRSKVDRIRYYGDFHLSKEMKIIVDQDNLVISNHLSKSISLVENWKIENYETSHLIEWFSIIYEKLKSNHIDKAIPLLFNMRITDVEGFYQEIHSALNVVSDNLPLDIAEKIHELKNNLNEVISLLISLDSFEVSKYIHYISIGRGEFNNFNYYDAIKIFKQALDIYENTDQKHIINQFSTIKFLAHQLSRVEKIDINLPRLYGFIGLSYQLRYEYKNARIYLQRSIDNYEKMYKLNEVRMSNYISPYMNLINIHYHLDDFKQALQLINDTMRKFGEKSLSNKVWLLYRKARLHLKQKNYAEFQIQTNQALSILDENQDQPFSQYYDYYVFVRFLKIHKLYFEGKIDETLSNYDLLMEEFSNDIGLHLKVRILNRKNFSYFSKYNHFSEDIFNQLEILYSKGTKVEITYYELTNKYNSLIGELNQDDFDQIINILLDPNYIDQRLLSIATILLLRLVINRTLEIDPNTLASLEIIADELIDNDSYVMHTRISVVLYYIRKIFNYNYNKIGDKILSKLKEDPMLASEFTLDIEHKEMENYARTLLDIDIYQIFNGF